MGQADTRDEGAWNQLTALKALEANISRSLGGGTAAAAPAPEVLFSRLAEDLMSALAGRRVEPAQRGPVDQVRPSSGDVRLGEERGRHTGDLVRLLRDVERLLTAPKPSIARTNLADRLAAEAA